MFVCLFFFKIQRKQLPCSRRNPRNNSSGRKGESFDYGPFLLSSPLSQILQLVTRQKGPGRVIGIETGYWLDGPGIESRWGGAKFSALFQTGPGAHPASCTLGTGSYPGVKSGRAVTLTLHPLLVPWSRKCSAIPLLPLSAVRPVQGCTLH